MDTRNFSNLLIKISGIVIVSFIIVGLPSYVNYYAGATDQNFKYFLSAVIMPNLFPLLAGIFLFTSPEKITNKFITDRESSEAENSIDLLRIEQVALSVLGFYLLFQSASDFIYNLANWSHAKYILSLGKYGEQNVNKTWIYSNLIATVAELIFALWLIFKSEGIVRLVSSVRNKEKTF